MLALLLILPLNFFFHIYSHSNKEEGCKYIGIQIELNLSFQNKFANISILVLREVCEELCCIL